MPFGYMIRILLLSILFFAFSTRISGVKFAIQYNRQIELLNSDKDSIPDRQLLINGRIWKSLYSGILGGEFLFSRNWLNGEVTINKVTFKNIPLKYDIYNDQLISMINPGTFVQLNKELIKGFVLSYENKKYVFENFGHESSNSLIEFGQTLYKGKISFILKHKKLIKILAVENKYDEFYEVQTMYLMKDGAYLRISGKNDLLNVLSDKSLQIKNFIRENKIKISKNDPYSFIPVIKFYDSLK
jgi:hypothetical protein